MARNVYSGPAKPEEQPRPKRYRGPMKHAPLRSGLILPPLMLVAGLLILLTKDRVERNWIVAAIALLAWVILVRPRTHAMKEWFHSLLFFARPRRYAGRVRYVRPRWLSELAAWAMRLTPTKRSGREFREDERRRGGEG